MAFGTRRLRKPSGALSVIPSASPEDALEPALRALLVASGAAAGAICLYDESEGVLRLVFEVGLSDEGCRRLRRISLGDPTAWIAPLHSLLARRRQILERSSGADVPPLLEPAEAISAVACIPLHTEGRPRASLLLVGIGAMELDAANLREADPAVTDIARIVEAIGRRGQAAAGAKPPLTDLDATIVAPATRRRLESLGRPGQTLVPDQPTLADADFPAVLTESDESDDREAVDRAHSAELEHLTARLTEAERAWAREHSLRVEQELRYERARRRAETERNETVRRAREFVASAESLRSSAVAEAESIRAALAQAERLGLEARHAAQRMQAEADAARAAETAAKAECDQLVQALEEAHASAAEATSSHHQLEGESAALAAREAEVDARWRANLAEAERVLEHERRRGTEREAERLALTRQLEDATAREQELRAELDALVQRGSAEQAETLRRALEIERTAEATRAATKAELEALRTALGEAQRIILDAENRPPDDERLRYASELNERTEQARAAAVLELEASRSALAAAQADVLSARADAGRVREEVHSLVAERQAALAEAGRLASTLEETRAKLGASTTRAARLEVELDETRGRVSRMEVEARAREGEGEARWLARRGELESAATSARARVTELETDIARQTHELADARAREAHARELLRIVTEDREGIVARVTELARVAEEARASATSEAEAIRAALGNAQALIIQAEDEAQRARAESERHEAELRAIQSEREQLTQALEKARVGLGESERHRSPALPHSPAPSSSATVRGTAREERPHETLTPGPGVVAIVGGDDAFAASPPTGIRVAVLGPEPGLAGRLTQLRATRVVVNLASAGGLAAVASLRAEGYSPPLWGCLAVPDGGAVLPLGPIETAPRSLDPEAVLALLGRHPGGGTRLLAIGTTPDSLLGLRQTLTRAGVSMSIAWDAKQAADLLAMVRPEVVIVDLALPSRGGYQIVANLAVLDPQPLTVLLPTEGEDAAAAFAAALAERSRCGGAISHAKALQTILTQHGAAAQRT